MHTYHVSYSCYQKRMRILLDGKDSLSESSTIRQYMDEPLYCWADKLLPLLYREIEEEYALEFVGRPEESEIIKRIANEYPHCAAFRAEAPIISDSLQKRIISLSSLIKENSFQKFPAISVNACFVGTDAILSRHMSYIKNLDIRNQYCVVNFSAKEYGDSSLYRDADVVFMLVDDAETAEQVLSERISEKYAFVLYESEKNGFMKLSENNFMFSFHGESFFEIVFQCFFLFPLAEVFAEYANMLLGTVGNEKIKTKIKLLMTEKPIVCINAPSKIELNCSEPFEIKMFPEGSHVPELFFEYQLPGIVECSQQRIYGKKTEIRRFLFMKKEKSNRSRSFLFAYMNETV